MLVSKDEGDLPLFVTPSCFLGASHEPLPSLTVALCKSGPRAALAVFFPPAVNTAGSGLYFMSTQCSALSRLFRSGAMWSLGTGLRLAEAWAVFLAAEQWL